MRQFATGGFRVWNFSREAKLVYTGFGLFSLLAIGVSILFYEDLVGHKNAGIREYYAGEKNAPAPLPAPLPGGPSVDVAADDPPTRITVAVTYRKLLEVTHFHLFTLPVFLLILAHLFVLTGISSAAKIVWIAAAWLSSFTHLGAPWLVRYVSPSLAPLYAISGALMAVTLTVLTVYPIWVMWWPRPQPA